MKENLVYKGFYEIPGFANYCIDIDGTVKNKLTGCNLEGSINPAGYRHYRLGTDKGTTLTIGRHRLMAIVFKPVENYEVLFVNHIDGIKGHDVLSNLEWTTPQGNVEHAGEFGLTSKCLPVAVRCVYSGLITKYPSYQKCGQALGLSKDAISYRVSKGDGRIFPEGKQYRLASVTSPWLEPDIATSLAANGVLKEIQVRDPLTRKVTTFASMVEATKVLGLPKSHLWEWVHVPDQPITSCFIQIKLSTDPAPWREFDDPYLDYERCTGRRVVVITNETTGQRQIYLSAAEAASASGLLKTTLHWRLKTNGKVIYDDHCTYSYYVNCRL